MYRKSCLKFLIFLVVGGELFLVPCLGIICYRCDSISMEDCAMTLNELDTLPYVTCNSDLACATAIVDSITYRGCNGETPSIGATYRKSCSSNLCNKGVYPPGRLKCHHCQGENCVSMPTGKPRPCLYHYEEDQCYTEVLSSTEVYRGCKSDKNHTISADVRYCDYNGCNDEVAAKTMECAQCDSHKELGCKMDLFLLYSKPCNISIYKTCRVSSLLTHKESCFTYQHLDRVVRGCSETMPADISGDMQHIKECDNEDYCNIGCTAQISCLNCDSSTNELCRSNATNVKSSTCGSAEASSCYACEYDDWSIRRGCGKLPNADGTTRCYECDDGNGCNAKPLTRCYQCSSDISVSCATWERPGNIFIEECQAPAAPCLVATFQNGTTWRGCQNSNFNCSTHGVEQCQVCEGSFCNKGAFPPQRLWCHQCTGCDSITSNDPMPCTLKQNEPTDVADACLAYYDDYLNEVRRGCRSNSQLYYDCILRNNGSGCHMCNTNGCNIMEVQTAPVSNVSELKELRSDAATKSMAISIYHIYALTFSLTIYLNISNT